MKWNDYRKKKPPQDMVCYIMNETGFMGGVKVDYDARNDVFKYYDDRSNCFLLNVTHWIELPTTYIKV